MIINFDDIDEALDFYKIDDIEYKKQCYNCVNLINSNISLQNAVENVYKILFINISSKTRDLLRSNTLDQLFGNIHHPYITNVLLLIGYKTHQENILKYNLDEYQTKINKKRVKDSLTNDIYIRHYNGIRISQMLWGSYFINVKLIEVGRLQYELIDFNPLDELEYKECIKIHIPAGTKLDINEVKQSLIDSKFYIKKYFKLDNPDYYCISWILSNEIRNIVDDNSNIAKFYDLFDILKEYDGIHDILNFVFNLKECNNYNTLCENTSLQKKIKKLLLNNVNIKSGIGILKTII